MTFFTSEKSASIGLVIGCILFGSIAYSIPLLSLSLMGLLLLSEPVATLVIDYL